MTISPLLQERLCTGPNAAAGLHPPFPQEGCSQQAARSRAAPACRDQDPGSPLFAQSPPGRAVLGRLWEAGVTTRTSGRARSPPSPPGSPGAWDEPGLDACARGSPARAIQPWENKRCSAPSDSNRAAVDVQPHRGAQVGGGQRPWGAGTAGRRRQHPPGPGAARRTVCRSTKGVQALLLM